MSKKASKSKFPFAMIVIGVVSVVVVCGIVWFAFKFISDGGSNSFGIGKLSLEDAVSASKLAWSQQTTTKQEIWLV